MAGELFCQVYPVTHVATSDDSLLYFRLLPDDNANLISSLLYCPGLGLVLTVAIYYFETLPNYFYFSAMSADCQCMALEKSIILTIKCW